MSKENVRNNFEIAFIAIGSNLNDPICQVLIAIEEIKKIKNCVFLKSSKLHQTKPVGFLEQPDFINAVVSIKTNLSPIELLEELNKIEDDMGRVRGANKNGPRIIDLDILLFGELEINTEKLIIPHPRMHEREFVLKPLNELLPDLAFI